MRKELLVMFLVLPFMALISVLLLVSCSDNSDETYNKFPEQMHMVVRFETGSGANAVDSMKLVKFDGNGFKNVR